MQVVQIGNELRASSSLQVVDQWQYIGPQNGAFCDVTGFAIVGPEVRSGNIVSLQDSDYGKYYCFRAADSSGVYGYVSYFVGQTFEIEITESLQDGQGTLVASTSDGRIVNAWQYVGPLQTEKCDSSVFNPDNIIVLQNTVTWKSSDAPQLWEGYYCFRATLSIDDWVYSDPYQLSVQ